MARHHEADDVAIDDVGRATREPASSAGVKGLEDAICWSRPELLAGTLDGEIVDVRAGTRH